MELRTRYTFLALIIAQAAHSVEECVFGLWRVFLPSRWALDASVDARALVFALANIAVVAFGVWCYAVRVRTGHASAFRLMWLWAIVEMVNGSVHIVMAVRRGGYFPGVATASVLLMAAVLLAVQLRRGRMERNTTGG